LITEYIDGVLLKKMFIGAANSLERNKELVNALNVFPVPDGDTGTNMSLTMQSAVKQIRNLESNDIDRVATAVSNGSLMGARGNSGVILSQLFRGFAKGLKGIERLDTKTMALAFKLGSDTAYKAVMKPIEGTILTVARECAEKAIELSKTENDIVAFLEGVIHHGDITLQKTPDMLAVLKQAGVVDAGGKGLLTIYVGVLEAITGKEEILLETTKPQETITHLDSDIYNGEIAFGYCTEFIINNTSAKVEKFRDEISEFGDSLLVVGGENIIKVHVHTNNPGGVLERALALGELIDIKIDNMRYQHRSNLVENVVKDIHKDKVEKKYSLITVAMGEGISNVFKDLGVDYVIAGGQTMNPSTEDILKAIDEVHGEDIIVLPNNSNIILAATQAKELSDRSVQVLSTKTIPQGIAALLAFDEEIDVNGNIENMEEAIKAIKTGQITFAVRDTIINDIEIKKGNIIGISEGDIKSVGSTVQEVALDLVKNIITDENELITVFYGEEVKEEDANELASLIENELKDCDVEVIYGGQPLYYYIFSVE